MKYVEWVDPWPGLDENGIEVTCARIIRVSEADAIMMQRHYHSAMGEEPMFDGARLLEEFIIIHWADVKEVAD